MQESENYLELN